MRSDALMWIVEGDALRIDAKTWRFEFDDPAVGAQRIFRDWKTGTLRPLAAPQQH